MGGEAALKSRDTLALMSLIGSPTANPSAAAIYTVVAGAARHDLDVRAYLRDAPERLAQGDADLKALQPDVWTAANPEAIRTFRQRERGAHPAANANPGDARR